MKYKKNRVIVYLFLSLINFYCLNSQTFIDTVYHYKWGTGFQTVGRDAKYFPNNVFGAPSKNCSQFFQAASDSEVCSIGFGGEIIVGNSNCILVDGPGPDFIIFENAFTTANGAKVFAEPAIISVSNDGEHWIEFPFNSETLEGLAGINWTNGNADPFDPNISGGDAFDLATIKVDTARYIKIKDTATIVSKLPRTNKYYSNMAVVTGFDLDAVALLNISYENKDDNNDNFIQLTQTNNFIILHPLLPIQVKIFDILGNNIYDNYITEKTIIDNAFFVHKVYFIVAESKRRYQYLKFIK